MKSVKCDISKIDDNYIEATFQKDCKSVACVLVLQRLIETAPFGEDAEAISQQILNHNKFHSSIQRSLEVDRARDELVCALKARTHLRDLQNIIEEISRAIMWVNDREEEELVFDWGDKNIDNYIPRKQESYSKLMSDLEEKEKELNKLKTKVDNVLKNQHPASDKIEAYMDTLQTQWSWLLQITKCIHVHLKENAAYSQFFKEANETYTRLQKDHESIRKKFTCDKNTSLENLTEMIKNLEKEKDRIIDSKRQVQTLVSKSKNIVCLRPRNPEEKTSGPVIVKALCDFKQDQKGIMKGNEGILKDNSQRSKWLVTGPGGLEMLIPSVCLLIPPPNPLSISLANKNEQYYEAIMSVWSQTYINIKSLISWRYCMKDIQYINSLTLSMLSKMRPEEYRNIIKNLELHYQEFMRNSLGSEMLSDEDKRKMEMQYAGAQSHYDHLVIQLPSYSKTLAHLFSWGFVCVSRLTALQALLQHLLQAEDIVKVHEARLTEKETTSLDLNEVEKYHMTLKTMKAELEQKKGVLKAMESELSKAVHWNSQIDKTFHQCDVDLSRYSELVGQMTDRWRRIVTQIDSRVWDLEKQEKQLNHYKQSNSMINKWIQETRQRQDALQITKFNSLDSLMDHLNQQKALYSEIKGKKEKVEDVVKDVDTCAASIKDYELQLASYSAGLETLLNIPIKRTMLQSPSTELRQEAAELQSRYIELLTRSSDYYKFLGEMMKNMEELKVKMRNTKIDLLEEELRRLKDDLKNQTQKNKSMEDSLARYRLELTQSKEELISLEELKRTQARQCNSTKESLDSTQNQLKNLQDEMSRLTFLIEEEKRKRRLAEDRYTTQQDEYELTVRKRQKEFEELSVSKSQFERAIKEKEREIERLQLQLQDEASRRKAAELETSKVRTQLNQEINSLKQTFESEIHITKTSVLKATQQKEDESKTLGLQVDRLKSEKKDLEEELRKLQLSFSQAEVARRKAEEDAHQQRSSATEGNRFKKELESQIQNATRLQSRISELQAKVNELQTELEKEKRSNQDEITRRKRIETELERVNQTCREYTTTINTLRVHQEKESASGRRHDQELRSLKDELERSQKDYKITVENLNRVNAELKALQQQLLREQALVREASQRNDSLYKTIEDKSRMLNESTSEIEKLQSLTQNLTKERLRLEEELRTTKLERDDVKRSLSTIEKRYKSRLQSSNKEISELTMKKESLERELRMLQQRPVLSCRCAQTNQSVFDSSCTKNVTVQGLRGEVSLTELVDSNLLDQTDLDKVNRGQLTGKEIEDRLRSYLGGSDCIAGIYDEANGRVLPFYQAMKEGLLRRGTTLELLEAQAASGFIIDPVNNVCMTVDEAWRRALVGKEFKDKLLSAEKAVTGYKDPATGKIISLFQAIEKEIIEKGHGIRLLESQIASGGIIDPKGSHRIDVEVAYRKGYFDREMNEILTYEGDDTKGFFDPNTHENLTYLQLKKRCIKDPKTGLILLPLKDKKKPKQTTSQKNTLRKRRVVIVDPDTGKEMTVREAYHRELIDYDTFLELSEQECEWEEITIETSDGNKRLLLVDRKTGTQYDIQESLDRGVIDRHTLDKYRAGTMTIHEFAGLITSKSSGSELSICTSSPEDVATCSSPTQMAPLSPTVRKRLSSVSITLSPPSDIFDDQSPVGAIFDTETLEKITIPEAQRRGIVDNITAQRLLEAQVCTGGVINPATGQRLSLKDAVKQSLIDEDMSIKLKPAQKAYAGFEDVKTKRKLSAAEAIKEKWLPYEAGQRFLEFQYLTGGLVEPETGRRVSIEEAIRRGWLDGKGAQKLQDTRNYIKNLTCPKTKLKISYKEAMDNCMVEENNGMKMLPATSMSSKGISSPYNVSSGPNSRTGSRAGSRSGSRRGSVDYTSSASYSFISY
uniref:Desmoplakin a n=1 Tax=Cyprinus carpio carpio TaxID=630221 RepID=A0A8C0YRV1_CYPCA